MATFKHLLVKKNKAIALLFIVLGIIIAGYVWQNNTFFSRDSLPVNNEDNQQLIEERMEEYLEKRYFPRIFDDMSEYIKNNPEDPMGYKYFGIALSSSEYYEKSTEQLELALQKNVSNQLSVADLAKIYYFLGINYHSLKQLDLAVSSFNKSLEYDQDNYLPYDGLALVAIARKDYNQAIQLTRKELDLIPDSANHPSTVYVFYHLARCYVGLHDYAEAKKAIDIAKKMSRNWGDYLPPVFIQYIDSLKNEIESVLGEI